MPVALVAVGLPVDFRQIVPHADQVAVLGPLQNVENFAVGCHRRAFVAQPMPNPWPIRAHLAHRAILPS